MLTYARTHMGYTLKHLTMGYTKAAEDHMLKVKKEISDFSIQIIASLQVMPTN